MKKTETIKTLDNHEVRVKHDPGVVNLMVEVGCEIANFPFNARNCNQLARALRNAALQVEADAKSA